MICWEETFKKYGYYRALVRQKNLVIIKCDICSFIKEVKWLNSRESRWTNWRCKSCISRGLWENANYKLLNGKAISKAQFLRSKTISDSSKKLWSNDDYRNRISDSVKKSNISNIIKERWNSGTYDSINYNHNELSNRAKKRFKKGSLKPINYSAVFDDNLSHKRSLELSLRKFLQHQISTKKSNGKFECAISINDVLDLWRKQNGLCAISQIKMCNKFNDLTSVSIDRVDPNIGYKTTNIQLVCHFINFGKSSYSQDEIVELIEKVQNNNGVNNNLDSNDIIKFIKSNLYSKYKNYKNIIELYRLQNGKCAATGINLTIDGSLSSISIDRIDSNKPYFDDNVQLVCRFYNLGKRHFDDKLAKEFIKKLKQPQLTAKIIDFKQLVIKQIDYNEASNFIELYHYSKTHRGSINFGISLNDEIIAVCSFSTIIRLEVAKRLNIKHSEILELSRFCIHPDFHIKNLASYIVSKCIKLIKKFNPLLKYLVSFADATYGHSGIIYKATNWKLDGIVRPDYWYEDNDGNKWHKKTIWLKAKSEGLTEKPYYIKHNLKKIIGRHKYRYILKF